ncbi:UNVERIFIED_CONTAM: putative E3 ubiquitin-protein ligase HERC2 [Sesamum radiatum]|uniref:E3 ubiquitin-protein ligase HERC2 n=1 Tax=Sesamum radiatum TaxID=300843 RepID=A0AAW2S1R0_SESRA
METAMERTQQAVQEDDEEQQEIWSWGAGTDGQLATGRLQDEHSPQLLCSLSAFGPIIFLSCGGAHVIALSPGMWKSVDVGRGTSGQLGHGEMVSSLQPKAVKALESFTITHVSAGWNHSGFVSGSGAIYTCGDGTFGQLGHGDFKSQCSPVEVSFFSSIHVEQVACGMRHSLVLLKGNVDHQVYGFGSGKRGQLGISREKVKSTSLPQITMGLRNVRIVNISANGDHSAALSADGSLYTWGRGFGCASDACIPQHVDVALSLKEVALGWNHALLLTSEGEVSMLGGDRHGALSDPQKTSLMGDASDNGSVMTWGWGEHGQLGLGDTNDQAVPQVVSLAHKSAEKHPTSRVYCGSGFSFVSRTYNSDSQMRPRKLKI